MISDRYVDQEWEKTFDILQNTIFMILQSVASLFIIIILLCGEKMCYEIMSRLSIDLIMEIKSARSAKVADKYQAENWGHYGGNSLYNSLNHLDYNGEDKILLDCINFMEAFRKKVGEESKRIALYFSKPRFTLQWRVTSYILSLSPCVMKSWCEV